MNYGTYLKRPWERFTDTIRNNKNLENLNVYNNEYYNYLVNGGEKTPGNTVPTAPTTEEQYAAWLTGRGQKAATVKAPTYTAALTPEMGYAEYLKRTGMAGVSQKQYDATVRSAEADYAKGKATYGQKAETLGQRGLTGSGYGDYLTGASFAAMQNAKVAAADTKALTDAEMARGYGEYLTGVQQANAQAAVQAANANEEARVAAENANAQAAAEAEAYNREQFEAESADVRSIIANGVSAGLSDERIQYEIQLKYGNAFDGSLASWLNEGRTALQGDVTAAQNTEANSVYAENVGTLGGTKTRQDMLAAGYTEEQINTAMAKYSSDLLAQQQTALNLSAVTLENIPTNKQIDDMVTLGQLTEADAATLKATAATKRGEVIKDKIDELSKSNDPENAAKRIVELFNAIDKLDSTELSDADRSKLYALRTEGYINTVVDNNTNEPVTAMLDAGAAMGLTKSDANTAAREGFIEKMANTMEVTVSDSASVIVKMGENEDGKTVEERVALTVVPMWPGERKKLEEKLGKGNDFELKAYDGKLYMWNDGSWIMFDGVQPMQVGGEKKNAQLMYDILVKYYS